MAAVGDDRIQVRATDGCMPMSLDKCLVRSAALHLAMETKSEHRDGCTLPLCLARVVHIRPQESFIS